MSVLVCALTPACISGGHLANGAHAASCVLKVRDLHMRDSENVTTYGGKHLRQLAAALPEEECKHVAKAVAPHDTLR